MNFYKELSLRCIILVLWLTLGAIFEVAFLGVDLNIFLSIYLNFGILIITLICYLFDNKVLRYLFLLALAIGSLTSSYLSPGNFYAAWIVCIVGLLTFVWRLNFVTFKIYLCLFLIISAYAEYFIYKSIFPVLNITILFVLFIPYTIKLVKHFLEIRIKNRVSSVEAKYTELTNLKDKQLNDLVVIIKKDTEAFKTAQEAISKMRLQTNKKSV